MAIDKKITNVVPKTQQSISTTVEKSDEKLKLKIRACGALDDELREEFHNKVEKLSTDAVTLRSRTTHSNQGNEVGQDITIQFDVDKKIEGVNVVDEVIQLGMEFYDRQLERELARANDGSISRHYEQQLYFDDPDVEEFCLLYRGMINF